VQHIRSHPHIYQVVIIKDSLFVWQIVNRELARSIVGRGNKESVAQKEADSVFYFILSNKKREKHNQYYHFSSDVTFLMIVPSCVLT
jgi:hypothetical protein